MAKRNKPDSPAVRTMKRLPQADAAWLLGVTARAVRDYHDLQRNRDKTYNAAVVLKWATARAARPVPTGDDPLLAGGTSPNLERYRAAKADLAEDEVRERRKQTVSVNILTAWWESEVAGPLRRAVVTLKRQHGEGPAELILKAITKAQAAVEKRLAEGAPDD